VSAIRLRLEDPRRSLALHLRRPSLSVTFDDNRVYTFDLSGRLVSFFDAGIFYRRGLDHRLLRKTRGPDRSWTVETLKEEDARSTYERILDPVIHAAAELRHASSRTPADLEARAEAQRLFARVKILDGGALAQDAVLYREVYSPVAILPPDHYLSVVVQVTEGCSHNKCRFCTFYRDVPFRVKSAPELDSHMDRIVEFLGAGISIRQSLFLGDANALVVDPERLIDFLGRIRNRFTGDEAPAGFRSRGMYSFVDSFHTGFDRPAHWKALRTRGLTGVYLGVESGHDDLLKAMDKPSSREATLNAVRVLKSAGLQVGVILIAGLGGESWEAAHLKDTATLLLQLPLDRRDLVFFSPYQENVPIPGMGEFKPELAAAGRARQVKAWTDAVKSRCASARPRTAAYSLDEYVY
jgi:radical SAM superfamily enzyme YgiQ (UPF0313 family)